MPRYTFNPETLSFEAKDEPKYLKQVRLVLLILAAAGLVIFYFWLYLSVFQLELPKTTVLKRRHAEWEAKMSVLDRQFDAMDQTLTGIEQRDDDVYRTIYGLNPIPEDVVYTSGSLADAYNDDFDALEANSHIRKMVRRIDNLTSRVYFRSKALDETAAVSTQAGDMMSCVPNVPPILPVHGKFWVSSGYGYRTDPVYGGRALHSGQDFAAAKGTPVYCTGDGTVELARYSRFGYGNEIVVNHGYGYKTRYAHLNTIEVSEGMKVRRGEQIGTLGNTGKSTGPHLHYEVEYMDRKINPINFMDVNMPEEEYRAMLNSVRSEQSAHTASTMELLRRGRAANE